MGDDEELPPLAVQPRGSDDGPAGAQQYDDTASMLLAARQGPDALARHLEQARGYQFDEGNNGVQGGELPAVGEGPDEPEQPAVQQPSDYQAQLAALQARIERNQQMQEQGVNAAFERSRPSESEKWLSIAAALASPTQTGSLGETMGNVFQSLAGYKRGVRQAESTRQSELMRLRQAYDLAGINATVRGMKPRTAASTYDMNRGILIPKDRAVIVEVLKNPDPNKPDIPKYSDNTYRVRNAAGTYDVYDATRRKIGTVVSEGELIQ